MVVTVLVLMPLFKNLPEAVLAALIIHAVSHLWKVKEFRRYYAERRIEALLGLLTLLGVITIDVLPGLVIGVVSMLLLVVYNASRPHIGVLARVPGRPGAFGDVDRHPDYERIPGLLVLRLESPLFYANATHVRDRVKYLVGASNPLPKAVVLDAGVNVDLDITSAEALEQLVTQLRAADIDFALAEIRQPMIGRLQRIGLLKVVREDKVFRTVDEAVVALWVQSRTQSRSSTTAISTTTTATAWPVTRSTKVRVASTTQSRGRGRTTRTRRPRSRSATRLVAECRGARSSGPTILFHVADGDEARYGRIRWRSPNSCQR